MSGSLAVSFALKVPTRAGTPLRSITRSSFGGAGGAGVHGRGSVPEAWQDRRRAVMLRGNDGIPLRRLDIVQDHLVVRFGTFKEQRQIFRGQSHARSDGLFDQLNFDVELDGDL
jgi:hypothetical protein